MFIEDSLKEKAALYFDFDRHHMGLTLGIEFEHISKDKIVASMPVDQNSIQPFGILHGGASVVLAETLASVGGWFLLDSLEKTVVGLEINANHIRSAKEGGRVTGTAHPLHVGNRIQIWETVLKDQNNKTVCVSRCTLSVIKRS